MNSHSPLLTERQLSRVFQIIGMLSPHSCVTISQLARLFETPRRTIQRDIRALYVLGVYHDGKYLRMHRDGRRRIARWMRGE